MNIGITQANFREPGNIPDNFIRVDNGIEISLFISLSIFTCMLLGSFALFKFKVFHSFITFSGVLGGKNNVLLFVKKKSKIFLVLKVVKVISGNDVFN